MSAQDVGQYPVIALDLHPVVPVPAQNCVELCAQQSSELMVCAGLLKTLHETLCVATCQ